MRNKYALSSHGRVASYKEDVYQDGKLLEGSLTSGYRTLNLHIDDSNRTFYTLFYAGFSVDDQSLLFVMTILDF